jgi:hypothetical protein
MNVRRHGHEHGSWMVIVNDRRWVGDPRLAGFAVYVDGRRSGLAPLGENLNVPVQAGRHVVRIRGWWFLSPRTHVEVKQGETVRLSADIPQAKPWWRRIARGIFDPFHSLSLTRIGSA